MEDNLFKKSLNQLIEKDNPKVNAIFSVASNKPLHPRSSARPSKRPTASSISRDQYMARITERPMSRTLNKSDARPVAINLLVNPVARPVARTVARPVARPVSLYVKSAKPSAKPRPYAMSLIDLGEDIMSNIKEKLKVLHNAKFNLEEYRLVEGIPENEIQKYPASLLQNKNALYYLTETSGYIVNKKRDYYHLSSNTNPVAIELIKYALDTDPNDTNVFFADLAENPSAGDILVDKRYRERVLYFSDNLSKNTNEKVINFLKEPQNSQYINWQNLSANESPAAIALLNTRIITNEWDVYRQPLSKNASATELLNRYPEKVVGEGLSANRSEDAFALLKIRLQENPKDINWFALSANPANWAFDFLQLPVNEGNIKWGSLSANTNPKAIELLKVKIEEENKILKNSYAVYIDINKFDKIDWFKLSSNPSAIELIKERIKYETKLIQTNPEIYERLKINEKISYSELAKNPSIFANTKRGTQTGASRSPSKTPSKPRKTPSKPTKPTKPRKTPSKPTKPIKPRKTPSKPRTLRIR